MELALKFGRGGVSNGPATNFFVIHAAMVSVTSSPCRVAAVEFLTWQLPRGPFWNAGPPVSRYSMHFFALCCSDLSKDGLRDLIIVLSASMSILVSGFNGIGFDGKLTQNSFDAFNP